MDYIGLENLRPGDMTITNDPFLGNVPHLPDLHIHCPVFYKGDLVFITCNTTHNVDIGGSALAPLPGDLLIFLVMESESLL
jgi:N-methylhydantoinase B